MSYVINPPPQPGFPALDSGQEKFNSRPVAPKAVVLAASDRSRGQGDYSVDVAVQKKFETETNVELDPLTNLVEEIADHFRGRRLASYPNAAWIKTEQTVLYAPEHIDELPQFTSVLTLTYRVLR